MALPTNHPFDEVVVYATTTDVTTGKTGAARAPFTGKVLKVGSMVGAAFSTADATVTVSIGATAITGGSYVLTQAASAAGTTNSALPTAANVVNEDDPILFAQTGSGTAGGFVTHYAIVRKRAGV